ARVNSTVFVNQTSTNGVLFSQENTANLSKMHRLVITNEQDYIVSNPFILSTEFSVSDTDKPAEIAVLSVAEPITIFPLIEE
ncbi:MAG: hypothetical protein RI894_2278, partial [Bacteroidota bacterium]